MLIDELQQELRKASRALIEVQAKLRKAKLGDYQEGLISGYASSIRDSVIEFGKVLECELKTKD